MRPRASNTKPMITIRQHESSLGLQIPPDKNSENHCWDSNCCLKFVIQGWYLIEGYIRLKLCHWVNLLLSGLQRRKIMEHLDRTCSLLAFAVWVTLATVWAENYGTRAVSAAVWPGFWTALAVVWPSPSGSHLQPSGRKIMALVQSQLTSGRASGPHLQSSGLRRLGRTCNRLGGKLWSIWTALAVVWHELQIWG
jgi:hypothetical protein